jgi:hypothetical protein
MLLDFMPASCEAFFMTSLLRFLLAGVFAASPLCASPIIREPGVIYLSDFGVKPVRKKLLRGAPCYLDRAMTRFGGMLRFPQTVSVEAFAADVCRIRGNARQGGVAAWIPYGELEAFPTDFLANLSKAEERRVQVEALIAQREVAIGTTEDEVLRSVGKPQKKTKTADKDSVRQVWEYIRYELVPQTTVAPGFRQRVVTTPGTGNTPPGTYAIGNAGWTSSTVYVKVPAGKLAVSFRDGIVEELEQTEGTLAGGQVSVVVPPLEVLW